MWRQAIFVVLMMLILLLGATGCAAAPPTWTEQHALVDDSQRTLQTMLQRDEALRRLLETTAGYAIVPQVEQSGAGGHGTVYDREGTFVGFCRITPQPADGFVHAGSWAMVVIFETDENLEQFTSGSELSFNNTNIPIAIDEGSPAAIQFSAGIAVFTLSQSQTAAGFSLNGQSFEFQQAADAELSKAVARAE